MPTAPLAPVPRNVEDHRTLRVEYHKLVKRILDEQQVIDCYAGWVSAQIHANGTVWSCYVRADDLGNLGDHNYDFKEIWFGEKIKQVRRSIAARVREIVE